MQSRATKMLDSHAPRALHRLLRERQLAKTDVGRLSTWGEPFLPKPMQANELHAGGNAGS